MNCPVMSLLVLQNTKREADGQAKWNISRALLARSRRLDVGVPDGHCTQQGMISAREFAFLLAKRIYLT